MKKKGLAMRYRLILVAIVVFVGLIGLGYRYFIKNQSISVNDSPEQIMKKLNLVSKDNEIKALVESNRLYLEHLKKIKGRLIQKGAILEHTIEEKELLKESGDQYFKNQLLDIALETYEKGLQLFPFEPYFFYKTSIIYANMAVVKEKERELLLKKAYQHLLKAIDLYPEYKNAYYSLAVLYFLVERYRLSFIKNPLNDALSAVTKYIHMSEEPVKGYFLRARIYYELNDKFNTIKTYQVILTLTNPKSASYKEARSNLEQLKE